MSQLSTPNSTRQQQGFTLVELVVTLAVVSIIAVLAAPSFSTFFDKRRVIDAAEDLYSNMQKARSEAIARNIRIFVKFNRDASGTPWQYGISETSDCDLTVTDPTDLTSCAIYINDGDADLTETEDRVLQLITQADYQNISISYDGMPAASATNVINEFELDPTRGTTNPGANHYIELTSEGGKKLRIKIGLLGQIRLCSPAGSGNINGYSSTGC